jgi:hypothetical protein
MNSFNKNKSVVSICKNYYTIVNNEVYSDDKVTHNMINLYKDYIFNMENITSREREKMVIIDNIMYKFVTDSSFKSEMCSRLSKLTISRGVSNVVEYIMNKLILYFEDYKDTITRNIYIPRWI